MDLGNWKMKDPNPSKSYFPSINHLKFSFQFHQTESIVNSKFSTLNFV
jgi:hypothetical protein